MISWLKKDYDCKKKGHDYLIHWNLGDTLGKCLRCNKIKYFKVRFE